ncbi:AMP-binding protein [Niveibacterium terrae]|uniref:AMP-binding protein n=1 Tax=Niveibacterium terrae TaxID=3373598 RepID=UPI003A942DBE
MAAAPGDAARLAALAIETTARMLGEIRPDRVPTIDLDSHFGRDLELDSLARVELIGRLGEALALDFPERAYGEADSLRELLRCALEVSAEADPRLLASLSGARSQQTPDAARSLIEVLEWRAARESGRTHVVLVSEKGAEQTLSFGELLEDAALRAGGLREAGLKPGETVALMLPTGRDYLACFFGVLLAGGVPVPIYPPARLAQVDEHVRRHAKILANAGARVLVTTPEAGAVALRLRAAAPCLERVVSADELAGKPCFWTAASDDLALLQYTSGSTADPKGVMLTHAKLLANLRAMGAVCRVSAEDCFVSWLPLYHDMGLIGAWFGALYFGFPLVLMSPLSFLAHPVRWPAAISRHRGTISAAPNFAYALCARKVSDAERAGLDLSSWRLALNGAEPVSSAVLEAFAARFAPAGFRREALTPVYGLAEDSVGLAFPAPGRGPKVDRIDAGRFNREGLAIAASAGLPALEIVACGSPLPEHEIRIVDELGDELPDRRVGRLEFRGPSACSGYFRNPEANARLFHNGWLDSGDMAYLAEGELYLAGRVKDMIIRAGRNFYPYDLEQAVGEIPGVRRGAVVAFACPGKDGAERLVLLAETAFDAAPAREQLRRAIAQRVVDALGEAADEIVLVPPHAILKTSSGKLRRAATRDLFLAGALQSRALPPWLQRTLFAIRAGAASVTVAARRITRRGRGLWALGAFGVLFYSTGLLVVLLRSPEKGRRLAHRACRLWLSLAGLRPEVQALERLPDSAQVLICNHASYLDGLLLSALLPPDYAFVAKAELATQRLAGPLLRGLGALFVERFAARQGAADIDSVVAALRAGARLVVFPEGTFTRAAGLRRFHSGAFLAAAGADVPLVVCTLNGSREAMRDGSWLPRPGEIRFGVAAVLKADGSDWSAAARLAREARAAMRGRVEEADLEAW